MVSKPRIPRSGLRQVPTPAVWVGIVAIVAIGLLVTGPTAFAAAQRSTNQQRTYVSVVDKKGERVGGLTPADFSIKEDGRVREVLSVEPATEPMQIALLVDTSAATASAIPEIRLGLKAFAHAIWARSPDTEIGLYGFGERPTPLADFSSSDMALERQIDRLFALTGSGAYFIDAVVEAAGALAKRGAERSVIVAYVDENGPEFSNRRNDYVFKVLSEAHTSLWTVARQGFGSSEVTPENRERAIVIGDATSKTGGRSSTVFDGTAIKTRMADVAEQLLSQWVVTYGRPESLVPPERLEVKVTNSDWRLTAPRWTRR